jgi:DNA topoisomerase-3
MVDHLREVWPRLSIDEKRLFDVIARAYLAAVMPDFRYRQTTATLDVRGFAFRASGRQPIELGWRAAFPDWQPADEQGDDGQLLPALRNGETVQLEHPTIEDKETRPPPRYTEGTLIEAMQNAWRFVDDEVLRQRLKQAKGIGTPATRAEIIGGLKQQAFLIAQGKNIVPTDIGLQLFDVLQQADPALVDPGLTAELECLLDDVVIGKQEMIGAIDAVCDVAQRIIGKLQDGATTGGPPLLGDAESRPPTPAMKRFADSISRQTGVKPPPGYETSGSICRAFLDQHAIRKEKADTEEAGGSGSRPASPAQLLFAEKLAQDKGIVVPDAARASSAAMSAWIDSTQGKKRGKGRGASLKTPPRSIAPATSTTPKRKSRKPAARGAAAGTPPTARQNSGTDTPLRIPYGHKDDALKLGARYRAGGWYAPPGVDLRAFGERGWL